jgi:diacylglycerol kinase family enzyme
VAGATLIINPYASSVTEGRVHAVERELAVGWEVTTVLTERRGHAVELARDVPGDAIFAFGGDGVFNEVLNGVDGTRPVGFLPGGGTNVLPRALGLPRDPVEAARGLINGLERRISLGRVNGRRFGFAAGIGLDAAVVRRVDKMGRGADGRRPGDLAFVRAVVGVVASQGWRLPDSLELEGGERVALVTVSNDAVYTYAGSIPFRFSPQARFELGLDYAALPHPGAGRLLRGFARAALGRGLPGMPGVVSGHDVDRLEVRCTGAQPLQVDGEDLGDVTEAVFEAERDAVTVLVQAV